MFKWKIEVILKSGKELTMCYEGDENSSMDIGKKLLEVDNVSSIMGLCNKEKTTQFFVKVGEIASMAISPL